MYKVKKMILVLLVAIGSFVVIGCGEKINQSQIINEMPEIAKKYDGKIVRQPPANRGKEDGWFLVKNGMRSWIVDGSWLVKNGYQPTDVIEISSLEFDSIPEDPMPAN